MSVAERAVELIAGAKVVGLGSGRAATAFVRSLGEQVKRGLRISAVPTSQGTADLARELGIPLVTLAEVDGIDVTVDGADEVDPNLDLIKGLGGALVREKIVAAASRRLVILVGAEKLVSRLGEHGVLPVEVVPFATEFCRRQLAALGLACRARMKNGNVFVSDNGNHVLDCQVSPIAEPAAMELAIRSIPGVVGTGLFLGMAHTVLVEGQAEMTRRD